MTLRRVGLEKSTSPGDAELRWFRQRRAFHTLLEASTAGVPNLISLVSRSFNHYVVRTWVPEAVEAVVVKVTEAVKADAAPSDATKQFGNPSFQFHVAHPGRDEWHLKERFPQVMEAMFQALTAEHDKATKSLKTNLWAHAISSQTRELLCSVVSETSLFDAEGPRIASKVVVEIGNALNCVRKTEWDKVLPVQLADPSAEKRKQIVSRSVRATMACTALQGMGL